MNNTTKVNGHANGHANYEFYSAAESKPDIENRLLGSLLASGAAGKRPEFDVAGAIAEPHFVLDDNRIIFQAWKGVTALGYPGASDDILTSLGEHGTD